MSKHGHQRDCDLVALLHSSSHSLTYTRWFVRLPNGCLRSLLPKPGQATIMRQLDNIHVDSAQRSVVALLRLSLSDAAAPAVQHHRPRVVPHSAHARAPLGAGAVIVQALPCYVVQAPTCTWHHRTSSRMSHLNHRVAQVLQALAFESHRGSLGPALEICRA